MNTTGSLNAPSNPVGSPDRQRKQSQATSAAKRSSVDRRPRGSENPEREARADDAIRRSTLTLQAHQRAVSDSMKRVEEAVGQYDEEVESAELDAERRRAHDVIGAESPRSAQLLAELALLPPAIPADAASAVAALESALENIPALSEALEELDVKAFSDGSADVVELSFEALRVILVEVYSQVHGLVRGLPAETRATVLQTSFRGVLRAIRSALAASHVGTERLEAFRWKVEDAEAETTRLRQRVQDLEARLEKNAVVAEWAQGVSRASISSLRQMETNTLTAGGIASPDGPLSPMPLDAASPSNADAPPQAVVLLQVESAAFLRRVADGPARNAFKTLQTVVSDLCTEFGGSRVNHDGSAAPPEAYACVFSRVEAAVLFSAKLQLVLLTRTWPQQLLYYAACRPVLRETCRPAPQGTEVGDKPLLWSGLRVRCAVHSGILPPPVGSPPWYSGAVMQRLGKILCSTPGGFVHVSARCWQAYEAVEGDTERKLQWSQPERELSMLLEAEPVQQSAASRGGETFTVLPRDLVKRWEKSQANEPQGRFPDEAWWEKEPSIGSDSEDGRPQQQPDEKDDIAGSETGSARSRSPRGSGVLLRSVSGSSRGRSVALPAHSGVTEDEREAYEELQQILVRQVGQLVETRSRYRVTLESAESQLMALCDPQATFERVTQPRRLESWRRHRESVHLSGHSSSRQMKELRESAVLVASGSEHVTRKEVEAQLLQSLKGRNVSPTTSSIALSPQPSKLGSVSALPRTNSISKQIQQLRQRLQRRQRRRYPPLQRMHGIVRTFAQLMRSHLHPSEEKGDVSAISTEQFMSTFVKKCQQGSKREANSVRASWRELEEQMLDQDEDVLPDEQGQRLADSVGGHLAKVFQWVKAWRRRLTARGRISHDDERRQSSFGFPAAAGAASAVARLKSDLSQRGSNASPLPTDRRGSVKTMSEGARSERSKSPQTGRRGRRSLHGTSADVDFVHSVTGMEARQRALQEKWSQRRREVENTPEAADLAKGAGPSDATPLPASSLPALRASPRPSPVQTPQDGGGVALPPPPGSAQGRRAR